MNKMELRPCVVKIGERTFETDYIDARTCRTVIKEAEMHKGYFHTWGSDVHTESRLNWHKQNSEMYGLVEYEDGTMHKVPPECIMFTDRREQAENAVKNQMYMDAKVMKEIMETVASR